MNIKTIKVGSLETNCYLIIKDNKCIIVDPGDEFGKIGSIIKNLELTPILIFVTHYHFDHIGALKECVDKYNVKVYDYKDYESDDKKYINNNFEFKIICTKGHKEDSVTYYFPNEKIMFVGDFIFKNTVGRCDLDDGDFNIMLESIKKIKTYPNDITIYPGHDEITNLKNEIENNEYFKII